MRLMGGELLLRYARRLLQLNAEAVACFLTPALEGTVRIGTPDDVGTRVLPQVLSGFAASHPAVQVDVMAGVSRVMLERLDAGEIDLALVTAGSRDVDPERGEVVATEPLRTPLSYLAARAVGAIGANAVTRHDAPASVRAGFHGAELSRLWPGMVGFEGGRGPFTHGFAARGLRHDA